MRVRVMIRERWEGVVRSEVRSEREEREGGEVRESLLEQERTTEQYRLRESRAEGSWNKN